MNFTKKFDILALVFIILSFSAIFLMKSSTNNKIQGVILGEKLFEVEVMDDDVERIRGLSLHSPLEDNQGMLFVFPEDDLYGFWMKDMLFPIDIIWIDKNLVIVHIETNVLPETYPKVFSPSVPARYVLELSAGQSDFLKLKIGDSIKILKKY
jgi:uncharacterized membrane protein (UPF0127 family)